MQTASTPSSALQANEIPFERTLLALSAAATVLLLGWLLNYARYGLDFSDEGFYLNWISTPFLYQWSATQFGFVYHPLFLLWEGDIARMRQSNVLIIFGLAWALFAALLRDARGSAPARPVVELSVGAGLATAALVVLALWLVTPSYNTLTLQALLITATGLVLTRRESPPVQTLGAAIVGIGGWLTFMAKPSSALALAVVAVVYMIGSRRLTWRVAGVACAVSAGLLLLSAWLIDGSVAGFVSRLQTSIALAGLLESGHSFERIFRIDSYQLSLNEQRAIAGIGGLVLIAVASALAPGRRWQWGAVCVSLLFLGATLALMGRVAPAPAGFGPHQGLVMSAFFMAGVALAMVAGIVTSRPMLVISNTWLALCFLVMPYVYAFGTNGNYWWAQSLASVFWLVAGVALLGPWARHRQSWSFALPLAFAAQSVCVVLLLSGINQPYRQTQALFLNASPVVVRDGTTPLILTEAAASYLDSAIKAAKNSGFAPGTPVIDLTGQSPTLLYALGAQSLGSAWLLGNYPGSDKVAQEALKFESCERLAEAWLLLEPSGPRSLSTKLMGGFGAHWPDQYLQAAHWTTSGGAGGYEQAREQQLFKPRDSAAVLAQCRALGHGAAPD